MNAIEIERTQINILPTFSEPSSFSLLKVPNKTDWLWGDSMTETKNLSPNDLPSLKLDPLTCFINLFCLS